MMPLLRLRLDFFKRNTTDLYKRYGDFVFLFLFLFGSAVIQAPTLAAQPILVFFEHPLDTGKNCLPILIWFSLVIVWAKLHKNFINGGTFSLFVKTMPIPAAKLRQIDFLMLMIPMSVFFIPITISVIHVLRSNTQNSFDAYSWYYFALILSLTFSLAKDCVYGRYQYSAYLHGFAVLILFSPPSLNMVLRNPLCISVTAICLIRNLFMPRAEAIGHNRNYLPLLEKLSWSPGLVFLRTNYLRLLQVHWHDSISRIVWALMPLGFAWWLIYIVANHRDAVLFMHLSLGIFVGIFSGTYKILFEGRTQLTNFAKSTGYGEWILSLFDYIVVVSLGLIFTLPYLGFFHIATSIFPGDALVKLFFYYSLILILLGAKWLQQHKQVVMLKFTANSIAILLGINMI